MNECILASYKAALTKHQKFLSKFKTFPQKTRKAIYAELLQLPLNHQHFVQLTKPYPLLPEHTIDKQVSFIVSAFCKLFPDLGNQWLPGLIHPFVRLFKEDAIASFQISLTFILNWFRPLFDDYPNSSKRIMAFFSKHLKKLEKKVNGFDYPLSAIIQPILLVALTDILNKQQTLQIYDFLVSHPFTPQLYLCILVVMVSKMQEKMLTLSSIQDIALQLRKEKKLNIEEVIKESLSLSKSEEEELSSIYSKVIFPLSTQRYPICQFIKKITPSTNKKLQESEQQQINRVQSKYEKLQKVVQKSLKENEVNYVEDINKKYSEAEGQMRQYLRQVKEEHGKKLTMIRNLENEYKQKINGHGRVKQLQYEKQLQAIERRGRVQREIQLVRQEADSIREAERQVLHRLQELSLAKKSEIQSRNAQLRLQQRRL